MNRALSVFVLCFAVEVAAQTTPPSCRDQGAERRIERLLTRIHDLERQLDASREALLAERARAAEAPSPEGSTSELRSHADAANREIERLRAANRQCGDALLEARKTTTPASIPAAVPAPAVPVEASKADEKTIAPGSLVMIRAENLDEMNVQVRVSPDGTIDLPLIGRLQAAGRTEANLVTDIEQRLSAYLVKPRVGVTLK